MSSSLYRTFKSNYVPYHASGEGRDRYILYDNAGFFHNLQKSLSPSNIYKTGTFFGSKINEHNKTQYGKAPNVHYHSNGSGRDKYIMANSGGLIYDSKPLNSFRLTDFLRKDDHAFNVSPIKKRISLTKEEIIYNKLLRDKEKEVIKRLYSNEKKKFLKKNRTTFFIDKTEKSMEDENKKVDCLTSRYEKKRYNDFNNKINKDIYNKNIKNNSIFQYNIKDDNYRKKMDLFSPSLSYRTNRDLFPEIKKINKYQGFQNKKKNVANFRKIPYFHILNEHSMEK